MIKKYRPYQADAVYNEGENVRKRDFSTTKKYEKWVSDITSLHTVADGWTYFASMMDLATNKMIGWRYRKTMDKSCVLTALRSGSHDAQTGTWRNPPRRPRESVYQS